MLIAKCAVSKVTKYFHNAEYSCPMFTAWKTTDDYGVNAYVYVVQFNGFVSLIR